MAITAANEKVVRKALAAIVETVPEAGYVIPSARYTSGREDYWASVDQTVDTKDEIETTLIAATWIYPVAFVDDFASGCFDAPLYNLTYEIYFFRQYGLMRADETAFPDVYDKKVLAQHNAFIAAWIGIKGAFQRRADIAGLSADFVESITQPVVQVEPLANQVICEFVPGVVGFAGRLQETVRLRETG